MSARAMRRGAGRDDGWDAVADNDAVIDVETVTFAKTDSVGEAALDAGSGKA